MTTSTKPTTATQYWTDAHAVAANREGWDLFEAEGFFNVERLDEWHGPDAPYGDPEAMRRLELSLDELPAGPFLFDDDVMDHLYRLAGKGSRLHLLALTLHGCRPSHHRLLIPEAIAKAP